MCLVAVAVVEAAPEASPEALASPFFFDLFKRCDCRNYYTKKCEQKSEQECETIYKDSCKQVYVEECEADKKQVCKTEYKNVCVDEQKQKCETKYKEVCVDEKKQKCETSYKGKYLLYAKTTLIYTNKTKICTFCPTYSWKNRAECANCLDSMDSPSNS